MKITELKCVICEGNINHNKITQRFTCSKCGAEHASEMFGSNSIDRRRFHFRLTKLKFLFAILGALYLLYLALRVFSY